MEDVDKKMAMATFRFSVIADFVTGVRLEYGERERLMREKTARQWVIPGRHQQEISRATICNWIRQYKTGGSRLEALCPKRRCDCGSYRSLDATVRMALRELKTSNPKFTVPVMEKKLRHQGILKIGDRLNRATVYRFLAQERESLAMAASEAEDRRSFEASYPNEIWQSDVLHGPRARVDGALKKTYLCAIMDDHSRLVVSGGFSPSENLDALKVRLKEGVQCRGLPQKLYVDNGACYSALHLSQITALLGIQLVHSRPYTPQGRGKVERFFRTVRESFLPFVAKDICLDDLNEAFDAWVEDYNGRVHGTTKMTPMERFRKNLACVRPAPANLMDYFRRIEFRRVRRDRTVQIEGRVFEVAADLIDRKVECRFHDEIPGEVEIFFNGMSYGKARILDRHVNARIGRAWQTAAAATREQMPQQNAAPVGGSLFQGVCDDSEVL